jgi:flagellar operon protein
VIDLRRLQSVTEGLPVRPESDRILRRQAPKGEFAQELQKARDHSQQLRFSLHALERMNQRGIELSPGDLERMQNAIETAASKGSRSSLVLMNENAFVISVPNRTVITALEGEALRDQIVTQIDSAVIL